jgi:pyruvate/2-oxoglutarate/acetoin dehydrogenase E1 component
MREILYRDAIREAMAEEMRRDPSVFQMGEDIAEHGGAFRVTNNLCGEFGENRIFDTPLSESVLVGAGVGAAMMGLRPVVEIMYADFVTIAMDAIVNHAAKVSYLTGGAVTVPLVVRLAGYGAGSRAGADHSQSIESFLTNVPGLTIVTPSTAYDAKGMLKAAIRTPNPVIFIEHKMLYAKKGEVPEDEYVVPLGVADIKREGTDVTLVAFGRMVDVSLSAARTLEKAGVSIEVIDLRSLQPLDEEAVLASVRKTAHLVIVHEAPVRGGFGGEVAAVVAEKALGYLDAPIKRVGAPWVPIPFSPTLEDAYVPQEADIVKAGMAVLGLSDRVYPDSSYVG